VHALVDLGHGQPLLAEELDAAHLEVREVIAVVDDLHAVRVLVPDADSG
jgi:hypothetical protein